MTGAPTPWTRPVGRSLRYAHDDPVNTAACDEYYCPHFADALRVKCFVQGFILWVAEPGPESTSLLARLTYFCQLITWEVRIGYLVLWCHLDWSASIQKKGKVTFRVVSLRVKIRIRMWTSYVSEAPARGPRLWTTATKWGPWLRKSTHQQGNVRMNRASKTYRFGFESQILRFTTY